MAITIQQALQKGIEAHRADRVQEADQYYTVILQAQPKHSDANHNTRVLAVDVGKIEQALHFFKIALEANPSITKCVTNHIQVFTATILFLLYFKN